MTEITISKPIYKIEFTNEEVGLAGEFIDMIHNLQTKINDHKEDVAMNFVKDKNSTDLHYSLNKSELETVSKIAYLIAIGFDIEIS